MFNNTTIPITGDPKSFGKQYVHTIPIGATGGLLVYLAFPAFQRRVMDATCMAVRK